MTSNVRRALLVGNTILRLIALLVVGGGVIYATVDFFGTLQHWWVGNVFSVAVVSWMESSMVLLEQKLSLYVAPVLVVFGQQFLIYWVAVFHWLGFAEATAKITLAFVMIAADLAFLVWFVLYTNKKSRRRKEAILKTP